MSDDALPDRRWRAADGFGAAAGAAGDTAGGAAGGAADGAPAARLPGQVVDAAIGWAVKLDYNDPAPETRAAFEQWLRADPSHALAWQRVTSLKQPFDRLPPTLLRATLDAADGRRARRRQGRRTASKLLALAGVALGAGWVVRERAPWQRLLADASTATGEQKMLRLADGTVVVLNTDSAVSTDLTGERRLVVLRRGEIRIVTGPDAAMPAKRPFWVDTPFGRLQALGTRFTVRLDAQRARISVQEGAVELHPAGGAARHVVRAGESRWLSGAGTDPADLQGFDADGWIDGVVAGKNIRLADLLDELARYRRGIVVCDPRVADRRVSGAFQVRDVDQTLRFVAQTHDLAVTYRTRFWVSIGP